MATDDRSGTCPLKLLRPRTLAAAAGGLFALAAWLLVVALARPDLNPFRQPTPFEELVAAVGTNRTVKGRLTGFQYRPVASVVRGRASGGTGGDDFRLLAAISRVQHASTEDPTPENLHAFGVALLLADDLNRAVAALNDAVNARSEARALSDLAAAYLERAVRFDRAEDLPQALALAERAITADGRLVEAWFNRAVALEELALPNRARHAWADYVQRDDRSEWTREARSRLSALEHVPGSPVAELIASVLRDASPSIVRNLVTLDAQAARELVEDSLLPRWGASVLGGRTSEAAQALAVAQLISGRLGEMTGDFLTARVVAAAARAPADRLTALAEGHVLWRAAREAYHRNDPAQFGPLFAQAQSRFEQAGSPMSLWTAHYGAVRLYFDGQVGTGVRVVSRLLRVSAAERSNALTARLWWDLGSMRFQQARFGDVVDHYSEALRRFEALGERDNAAAMHQSLAETYGRLGRARESWAAHLRALRLAPSVREVRRRQGVYTGSGYTALNALLPEAAAHFFLEAKAGSGAGDDPNYLFESEVGAGRALVLSGRVPEAEVHLRAALSLEPRVTIRSYRVRFGADLRIALAEGAAHAGDFDRVEPITNEALALMGSVASEYRIAYVHLLRGRARARLGEFDAARDELEQGIRHLESKRALIEQQSLRISYIDDAWDLYAELVGVLALDLGQTDQALEWADRGRARSLQEILGSDAVETSALDLALPSDTAMLFLTFTERGVFTWFVGPGTGILFRHAAVSQERIAELSTLRGSGTEPRMPERAALARGYDVLIRPFEEYLGSVRHLLVVPDWMAQNIPFSALWDSDRNVFLIERLSVRLTPSLSIARSLGRRPYRPPGSLAVFVDPLLPPESNLPVLPAARSESDYITALYSYSRVFTGRQATHQHLAEAVSAFDVLHVAAHTIADARYPDSLTLALADSTTAPRLPALSPGARRAEVIVLAACRTSLGPKSRGEVIMNLARPFLAAGVGNAVLTLIDVPDETTSMLMKRFHSALVQGLRPADALAHAQRAIAASSRRQEPWWAAFTIISIG